MNIISGLAGFLTHPDASIQIGDVVHKPCPLLTVSPTRSRALHQEIVRADPGSPFFEFANRIPCYIREAVRALPSCQWSLLELAAANPQQGLVLQRGAPWQIHDLRGARNADVSAETRDAVNTWLQKHTPKT